MKENSFISNNQSHTILDTDKKFDKTTEDLSDWQMYQMSINRCGMRACTPVFFYSDVIYGHPCALAGTWLLKSSYSYNFFFQSKRVKFVVFNQQHPEATWLQKNGFIRNFIYNYFLFIKYLHNIAQTVSSYNSYFFSQGVSDISLHFDALETVDNINIIIADFCRDGLKDNVDKKRIASRYQTLSFYDYDYFYQDKAPDETAVDFWLAMDRFLEKPYLTQKKMKENNHNPSDKKERNKNINNKDKLRNYVHKIMIVPDELLNNNEKNFRTWVRNPDNQKKFIAIYKKTFNRVPETGLKKIEGYIENQKGTIKSGLLFCKQKMSFKNLDGKTEEKFVYSLKLLNDGK